MHFFTILPHIGEEFWSLDLLLNLLWKSSLVWLLIKALSLSPSARQVQSIWRFGLFGLLAIFLLGSSSVWELQTESVALTVVPAQIKTDNIEAQNDSAAAVLDQELEQPIFSSSIFTQNADFFLIGLWWIGFLIILTKVILEYLWLRYAVRRAKDFDLSRRNLNWQQVIQQVGLAHSPRVLLNTFIPVPITFGWRRPIILLPAGALSWDQERVRQVLLHELIHIKRADYFFNLLSVMIKGLYWFNPISWIMIRQFRLNREWACDEELLAMGTDRFSYAENLVAIANLSQSSTFRQLAPSFAKSNTLATRIKRVLHQKPQASAGHTFQFVAIAAVVLVSLLSLSLNLRTIRERPYSKVAYNRVLQQLGALDAKQKIVSLHQLGRWGQRSSFTSIKPLVLDTNPEVQKKALWALQQIGCLPAFRLISQQVQDEDQEIQRYASELLASYPSSKLQAYLLDYLDEPSMEQWFIQHFQQIELLGQTEQLAHHLAGGNTLLQSQIRAQLQSLEGEKSVAYLQQLLRE